MRVLTRDDVEYRLPSELNDFQLEMYIHLINWKWRNITTEPGKAGSYEYDALLPASCVRAGWSPLLHEQADVALTRHRGKNKFRIHRHFYHMASSQAANANLFLPILHHSSVDAILGALKPDFCSLARGHLDNGYCLEFWGGNFGGNGTYANKGLLGDKSAMAGTDADIAIAYYNHAGNLCLWLIEHKLTEGEFTRCGGFTSPGRQLRHDCTKCFSDMLQDKSLCYYHDVRKFNYWDLTQANMGFFANHASYSECPFSGGMNQLWRNQLMALAIEQDTSEPYKHATFSVVKHPENHYLDGTLSAYRELIAGNPKFSVLTSADVISAAKANSDANLHEWIVWYEELYKL